MKKTLLTMALAALMMPAMATDYTDDLVVTVRGVVAPAQETTISVDSNGDGTYDFSLKNFSFSGIPVGDLSFPNVRGVSQDGVVYLATTQLVRLVGMGGIQLPVTMRAELRDNATKLYASMDIPMVSVTVLFGKGYQLPNPGFETFQDYTENLVDITTGNSTPTIVKEATGWHSFASAKGKFQGAATAFANPYTWTSSVVRPGSTGKSSLMITSSNVMGFQIANGTVTTGRMNCGSMFASDPQNHAEIEINNDSLDAHGDPYYAALNGQPDSLVVWYAFKQGTPVADHPYATVNAIITDGTYYQDPEDKAYTNKRSQAQNNKLTTTFTDGQPQWQRLSIPFSMIDGSVNPRAILVTISTNADPGAGSIDTLYVDDINLVYNTPKNVKITFDDTKTTIDGDAVNVTWDGALSARVVKDFQQQGDSVLATVSVYSDDLTHRVAQSTHTFKGTVSGIDGTKVTPATARISEIYDLSGRRVSDMRQGEVYIVKTTDGRTVKIAK